MVCVKLLSGGTMISVSGLLSISFVLLKVNVHEKKNAGCFYHSTFGMGRYIVTSYVGAADCCCLTFTDRGI